jgi:hypothetical protein
MDGAGSGSCPVAGFDIISGAEHLGSAVSITLI